MEGRPRRGPRPPPPLLLATLLGLWPGIWAKASFKEAREVLQVLAGNSSRALLDRCSELLFGRAWAQPRQVPGVLGGSVLLAAALAPNASVREIEWSFSSGAGATIQVAEFSQGGFERPDPGDRFKQRLEMFNATALRIRALEPGDSGVYGARVKLHPALVEDQSFNLSVYEPVPSPRTRSQLLGSSAEWCNVTLQCQGSGRGAVNVTWRPGSAAGALGTGHRQQLSADGTTLRLALPPGTANGTYACVVSNPADEKVVVFDLQSICRGAGGQTSFSKSGYVVLTLILLAVSLGGAFWCWRLNSEKAAEPAATPTVPAEESPPDPQYAEIVRRSPPEGNDQGLGHPESDPAHSPPKEAPVTTVYDQLRRAPAHAAQEAPVEPEHRDLTEGL